MCKRNRLKNVCLNKPDIRIENRRNKRKKKVYIRGIDQESIRKSKLLDQYLILPWNWWLCWSGGAIWFGHCQSCSDRFSVIRHEGAWFDVGESCLHCGPAVHSLKPHIVGDREKNSNTPVSPPQTRLPKPFCPGYLHSATLA